MKIAELMTRHVEFIDADATVREAAELMGELDVGALPVGGPDDLRGIVTDRDLLYRVVARGRDASAVRVREVLSSPVIGCREEDEVQAALDLMAAHHIRRLAVRDAAGRVSGWVTLADLARRLLVGSEALQASLRAIGDAPPAAATAATPRSPGGQRRMPGAPDDDRIGGPSGPAARSGRAEAVGGRAANDDRSAPGMQARSPDQPR